MIMFLLSRNHVPAFPEACSCFPRIMPSLQAMISGHAQFLHSGMRYMISSCTGGHHQFLQGWASSVLAGVDIISSCSSGQGKESVLAVAGSVNISSCRSCTSSVLAGAVHHQFLHVVTSVLARGDISSCTCGTTAGVGRYHCRCGGGTTAGVGISYSSFGISP